MPSLNMVVGSGLMLIEIVSVNRWKVPFSQVAVKYSISSSTLGIFGVPCWMASQAVLTYVSGQNATDAIVCMNAFKSHRSADTSRPVNLWHAT